MVEIFLFYLKKTLDSNLVFWYDSFVDGEWIPGLKKEIAMKRDDIIVESVSLSYKASGICFGFPWGSHNLVGCYSKEYREESFEKLLLKIKAEMKSGKIDGGFGFETVVGAIINIKKVYDFTVNHNGVHSVLNSSEHFSTQAFITEGVKNPEEIEQAMLEMAGMVEVE